MDPPPESGIAEIRWFETLPVHLTAPDITPRLFRYACAYHLLPKEATQ